MSTSPSRCSSTHSPSAVTSAIRAGRRSRRARGLAHAEAGRSAVAPTGFGTPPPARRACDSYAWGHAHCLDALAGELAGQGMNEEAAEAVARLETIAARGDMRELIVRAALHRGRLGDPSGRPTARLLAEEIDNPRLHRELVAA